MNTQITENQEMTVNKPEKFFHFGENWSSYVESYLTEELMNEAIASVRNFCGEANIKDKTFIDIGCGSGLFSLAAYKLGARKIISLDIDENSVACCKRLKATVGDPEFWQIIHGSITDDKFVNSLGKFDFMYSWGVLHHTGEMWHAIDNALKLVNPGGYACIAIYNKSDGFNIYPDFRFGNSYLWLVEKKIYCSLPRFVQVLLNYFAMTMMIIFYLLTFNNPMSKIRAHKSFRGMNWKTDIIDWLGGYPYEYASVAEIFKFAKERNFSLENLISHNGLLNNEYLFKKTY